MRANESFVCYPLRFLDALRRGDINERQFLIGCYLAGAIDFRTGEVALTLRSLADSIGWKQSEDTLERDLDALRPAWIYFETKQGQRTPRVFRLTGLAILKGGKPAPLPHDFRTETLASAEVSADLRKSEPPASSQPERDPKPPQPSHSGSPKKRREEKRRKSFLEGEAPDRFLDVLGQLNGDPPVCVEVDQHGALEWSQPPRAGEEGVLGDCHALVDAGVAAWIDKESAS